MSINALICRSTLKELVNELVGDVRGLKKQNSKLQEDVEEVRHKNRKLQEEMTEMKMENASPMHDGKNFISVHLYYITASTTYFMPWK